MSSTWAFLGGASNELLAQRREAAADERTRMEYDRRMAAADKMRQAAEEAARKNRVLASGLDRKTGELYEVTAGGEERRTKAPQAMLDDAMAAEAAAAAKAAREERKFETEVMSKTAQAEAARAQAGASLASAARGDKRLASQIDLDKARAERARRESPEKIPEADKEAARETDKMYSVLSKSDTPAVAEAAKRIRFSSLTPAQKQEALLELMQAAE